MAWMRMMGVDSVAYHRSTVLARGDDHPGQALEYYASRGETPLVWGGSGASELGLEGAVTDAQYETLFGPGGACDPTTGARLVNTRRPGLELVVSAHKSVAELGVIGRAEDMHAIMDTERTATLAYLDLVTTAIGGRRGRGAQRTATEGLIYATTRHATSRAGDPCPHDHVLVANLVRMDDALGGWKAADTALWREHLHAATMVGRVASAERAVELGYGIVADNGPSGRLGHWAIAGVPEVVMEAHSKRAAEIDAEMARTGHDSYRARSIAARTTRDPKRHTSVGELMPRWTAEIEHVGWSIEAIADAIEREAPLHPGAQQSLFPSVMFRYWGHYTDADGEAVDLDVHMRAHAHVEDNIRRLKDSGAHRFPFTDIDANRAWLAVVCFADGLVRWFQQLCITGALAIAEPKTLRWGLWHTPARIVNRARRRIVRVLDGWPNTDALLAAYGRIAALA